MVRGVVVYGDVGIAAEHPDLAHTRVQDMAFQLNLASAGPDLVHHDLVCSRIKAHDEVVARGGVEDHHACLLRADCDNLIAGCCSQGHVIVSSSALHDTVDVQVLGIDENLVRFHRYP